MEVLPQIKSTIENFLSPTVDFFITRSKWGEHYLVDEIYLDDSPVAGGFIGIFKYILYKSNFFLFFIFYFLIFHFFNRNRFDRQVFVHF